MDTAYPSLSYIPVGRKKQGHEAGPSYPSQEGLHMTDDVFGELIFAYSRQQALADGVLIDVSAIASEAGFQWPIAVTRQLWDEVITPSPEGREQAGQTEEGRLWDTLWVLRSIFAKKLRPEKADGYSMLYKVLCVMGHQNKIRAITVKCVLGGDDNGNPCLTLMLPDED